MTRAMNTPRADGSPRAKTGRSMIAGPGASPRSAAVLLGGQIVFNGAGMTTKTKRATISPSAPVVVSPAASPAIIVPAVAVPVSTPRSNAVLFGGLVLSGKSQAQKASQNNLKKIIKNIRFIFKVIY